MSRHVFVFLVIVVDDVTLAVIDILVILLVKQRDAHLKLHQIQQVYVHIYIYVNMYICIYIYITAEHQNSQVIGTHSSIPSLSALLMYSYASIIYDSCQITHALAPLQ